MIVALLAIAILIAAGAAFLAWRVIRLERIRSAYRVAALSEAIDGSPATTMFVAPAAAREPRGFPIRAAVAATMLLAVTSTLFLSREDTGAASKPAGTASAASLELMEMRDRREGASLTVSGLVRNPRDGAPVTQVMAVVLGFDRNGAFVTSNRAELDFLNLQPGDESPFVVTLPNGKAIARYRVAFRTEGGSLRHVDRRERPETVARMTGKE